MTFFNHLSRSNTSRYLKAYLNRQRNESRTFHLSSRVYSHMLHLFALRAELRQIGGLLAVVVHVHAQAGRVPHPLLADVALEGALTSVVLVPDVHLQVVTVREESVAGGAFHAARFAIPTCWVIYGLFRVVSPSLALPSVIFSLSKFIFDSEILS